MSEIIEASLEKRRRPSLAQIFDFESRYVNVDTLALWAGRPGFGDQPIRTRAAYDKCVDAMQHDDYVDVHATTWTPASFAVVLRTLFELDLVSFRVAAFHPTPFNSLEFYVTLERLSDDMDPDERRRVCLDSLPTSLEDTLPPPSAQSPVATDDGRLLLHVSDREARMLELKRRLLAVSRAGVQRARRVVQPQQPKG